MKIRKITPLGEKRVINLTVKKNHTFITGNGIATHNCDRLSPQAMDALKVFIEDSYKITRFIFITNHVSKIIPPLMSRLQHFSFGDSQKEKDSLIKQMAKRCASILKKEGVEYEGKALFTLVQKTYPDFRACINKLQQAYKAHGSITDEAVEGMDSKVLDDLVKELKNMNFNNIRKMVGTMDSTAFYGMFYDELDTYLKDSCKPEIVSILGEGSYRSGISISQEINLACTLLEIAQAAKWK